MLLADAHWILGITVLSAAFSCHSIHLSGQDLTKWYFNIGAQLVASKSFSALVARHILAASMMFSNLPAAAAELGHVAIIVAMPFTGYKVKSVLPAPVFHPVFQLKILYNRLIIIVF